MSIPVRFLDHVIEREGGYVDHPADRGGPTKYGITLPTLQRWRLSPGLEKSSVEALQQAEARDIYERLYWINPGFNKLGTSEWFQELLFDAAVNHGVGGAVRMLQRTVNVAADGVIGPQTRGAVRIYPEREMYLGMLSERYELYARLVANDPSQGAFILGWVRRLEHFLKKLR